MDSRPSEAPLTSAPERVDLARHRGLILSLALAAAGLTLCLTDTGRDQLARLALLVGPERLRVVAARHLLTCPPRPASPVERKAKARRIDAALVEQVLADPSGRVRDTGLVALESWRRPAGPEVAEPLVAMVCSGRMRDSYAAARLLRSGLFGPVGGEALQRLLATAESDRPDLELDRRCLAIQLLGFIAPAAPTVITTLTRIVEQRGGLTASVAAESIGYFGERSRSAIPALRRALRARDTELRAKAAEALGAIGPTAAPAIDELLGLLDDPESVVRVQAIRALGSIGTQPRKVLPRLESILCETRHVVEWQSAIISAGDFGARARSLLPVLERFAEGELCKTELADAIRRIRESAVTTPEGSKP